MSFDLLAPHYRWMEFILAGEKLQRCRTAFLPEISEIKNALVLGPGHGRFLAEFARTNPTARITCVDASKRMLQISENRLRKLGCSGARIEFVHADVTKWIPPQSQFDLVATHFFLDCFTPEQLERIVENAARAMTKNARWLLADFNEPEHGLAKWRARLILKLMYCFFRKTTNLPARYLTPPDLFLQKNQFKLLQRRIVEFGLLHSDLWSRETS